tara:strand:+ start:20 stop:589 length:570 start_codon:yes stop_codon:yes gene_type:complete
MSVEIFNEDLIENFDNKNLREKLIQLVKEHKIIIVKGLSSAQRHKIYSQMYYPLKFEKIVFNENDEKYTDIKIYNCKIKQKVNKQNDNNKEEIKQEDEYILEDSEEESSKKNESETEESYITDEDEELTKLEDIGSQILEIVVNSEKEIYITKMKVNIVIIINIIGWYLLYVLDPVRVINIKTRECEIY